MTKGARRADMRRRAISVGSVAIAVAALAVVLLNATLVDRRGPGIAAVSLSAPVEGETAVALTLTAIDVQFSEPVRAPTVEQRFRIEPYVAGSISWDGSTATFTPSDKLPQDTEFTVSIEPGFEDLSGNAADAGLGFTFRTVGPPTVVTAEPAEGAGAVPVDAEVAVTFDRLMDTTSVEDAVRIEPEAGIRPSWSGRTVTLAFDRPLQFGTTYTLSVGTGAEDTDGSRLRQPFRTSFTTVDAGLGVQRTIPSNGTAGISVRTPIAVFFDGPIDAQTIEGAISVTPPVDGDLRVVARTDATAAPRPTDPPGTVLVLQPAQPLAAHTTYTVRLDPIVARGGDPETVAAARSWTFTTGQPTTSAHNHVAWLSARGGVRDVWLMNPDGSAPRQLTAGLAPVSGFDVTVDGTRVAFAAGGVVRTMRIDGEEAAVLTSGGRFEYAPRFSPDGRRLLVARREADGSDAGWWILPMDPSAGDERQVLPAGAPPSESTDAAGDGIEPGDGVPAWASRAAWDPTGRWVAITAGDGAVFVVDVEPEEPAEPAATGLVSSAAPAWSAAGDRFLVVARSADGEAERLFSVGVDGRVEQRAAAAGSVAVTDGGVTAYLVRDASGMTRVAIAGSEGAGEPRVLTTGDASDRWPAFSPDGQTLLFGRVRGTDSTESGGIWTIGVTSDSPVPLTTDGAYPRWLP